MNTALFFTTWLAGLPGVIVVAWFVLPILVADRHLSAPLWVVQVGSALQSAVLLGLATAAGTALAPKVGLAAPVFSALIQHKHAIETLRPQLLPSLVGGLVGATILWVSTAVAPKALAEAQTRFSMPIVARLLYGGITEELLIRWGGMTLLVWLLWHLGQGGAASPSAISVYLAICLSSLLFGAGHLPAVASMVGHISVGIAIYVIAANAAFGIVAGWLYWRFGLESAILAHILAHGVFLLVSRRGGIANGSSKRSAC